MVPGRSPTRRAYAGAAAADNCLNRETDPTIIVSRVSKAPTADVDLRRIDPFSEQGVNNLAQLGRTKLTDWLRQGL